MLTGWNTLGTALEARTAMPVLPRLNRIGWPVLRSVATAPKRIFSFSIGTLLTALFT